MDDWISFKKARPRPNSRIAVKGFARQNPEKQVVRADVCVDGDGEFPASADIEDTHWQYAGDGAVVTAN